MYCTPNLLGGVSSDDHIWQGKMHRTAVCMEGVSTTKQALLWHLVTGQSKRRKTPGSFAGPLSYPTVSDGNVVEHAKWLVSKTLTYLINLLGFAM